MKNCDRACCSVVQRGSTMGASRGRDTMRSRSPLISATNCSRTPVTVLVGDGGMGLLLSGDLDEPDEE